MSIEPRYRLQHGRPKGQLTAAPTRLIHVSLPLQLFEDCLNDMREADVAHALSFMAGQAYMADYVRAALLTFHLLLQGGTRSRVLSLANLPEDRVDTVIAQLEFVYAALPAPSDGDPTVMTEPHPGIDPNLHADMYMRQEGVKKQKKGKAPLAERDPWNKL